MRLRRVIFVAAAIGGLSALAHAQNAAAPTSPPAPSPAPAIQSQPGVVMMAPIPDSHSEPVSGEHHMGPHVLTDADHAIFAQAFAAVERGDWDNARTTAARGSDKTARDLVTWRYLLDESGGASFDDIDKFLRAHPDWPRHDALLARAEKIMPDTISADAVITWFSGHEPASGYGDIRLGEALMKSSKRAAGEDRIRKGWIEHDFGAPDEVAILSKHSDLFSPDVNKQRLEHLLWNDSLGAAERQMARVPEREEKVAEARIKLSRGQRSPHAVAADLPPDLRDDVGVLFDEARAYRRQNDDDHAQSLLSRISDSQAAHDYADQWWDERHLEAREAIKDDRYRVAYSLVSQHHLVSGSGTDFTDAEFLAGWIALRCLKNPKQARPHFEALNGAAGTPVTKARAQYWLGRTDEELEHKTDAVEHYHQASQYTATFYGQLAFARINENPVLHVTDADPAVGSLRASFDADDRTHAMRVLAEMGEDDWLRTFASHEMLDTPDGPHMKLLAELMHKLSEDALSLRAAKQASYGGVQMLTYSHPVISVPSVPGLSPNPEPALVLGIVRQETEFDAQAVSHAGALGLMQIMPATVRETANAHGLRSSVSDLIADPQYNMQMGQAQLSDFLQEWNGSYVLAAAAYNAGDRNVKKWVASYGDPRQTGVDPIDWIERIPFGETRNYVQRVLENTGVYRNRLAGSDQKLNILADLYRPRTPEMEPLHYEPEASTTAATPKHKPSGSHAAKPKKKKTHKPAANHAAAH